MKEIESVHFRSVAQSCQFFVTAWMAACQASLSITNSWSLPKLMSRVGDAIQPCHLLSSPSPPALNLFQHKVLFQWRALHLRWPKYWSFSFNVSPSNEHPGLIPFRMDRLDLLAVQGTLKSLLQHHSSKASTLWCLAFFMVQLSNPYMTTGKTITLIRLTFVGKVMSLLFNILSRLVITFLPRTKHFLISWLQSPSAVILEPRKESQPLFPLFSHLFALKWWDRLPWSYFSECWALSQLFHFPQEAL